MITGPRDQALLAQVVLIDWIQQAGRRVADRINRVRRDEAGQTPTEYLMIVGLMAVVIITVFVTFYWTNVKTAASTWVGNVKQAVVGTPITP